MKVLVTGCSSAQTSESVAKKLPTFTGLLVQALREAEHDVVWDTPTMRWDEKHLAQFDSVVVGLSAPTSITAHRLYGALSVIEKSKKVTDVKYLIDAPEPHKLWNGIRWTANNPQDLVKPFYSRRSEFSIANNPEELKRLHSVVVDLYENNWNDTIVPSFPWFSSEYLTREIPNLSKESIKDLCLDLLTFKNLKDTGLYIKSDVSNWSYETKTPWISMISKTLVRDISPLVVSKSTSSGSILSNLNKSVGTLISTYKNNDSWWSVNLAQSLYVNTPVVSDWKHTFYLGDSWSILPHSVEEMPLKERVKLAQSQREAYLGVLGTYEETLSRVSSAVFGK